MLTGYLGIGLIAGLALFIGKFVIYNLVMSLFPKGFKQWIYDTPIMLIAIDFGFAGLASPVTGMAGGTIAMLTMITFVTLSGLYVGYRILTRNIKRKWNKIKNKTIPIRQSYIRRGHYV